MSLILHALKKTQNIHKNQLTSQTGEEKSGPLTAESERTPVRFEFGWQAINLVMSAILAITMAGIIMLLNDRITASLQSTQSGMAAIVKGMEDQNLRITKFTNDLPQQMQAGFEALNQTLAQNIETLKDDIKDQQAALKVIQEAQQSQIADLEATRQQLAAFKNENKNLENQLRLLKEKVDSINKEPAENSAVSDGNFISGEYVGTSGIH